MKGDERLMRKAVGSVLYAVYFCMGVVDEIRVGAL